MITSLMYIILAILIGLVVRAFALPIVKHIVTGWTRLYVVIASEEGKTRREEVLSYMHEQISFNRNEGDASDAIALKILLCLVTGLRDDVAWCAPFVPGILADKTARWSDALRHFRTPKLMIPSLATLGFMNLAFFSSQSGQTVATWVCLNGVTIAVIVLMWKLQHPLARRIFYSWIGAGTLIMMAFIVWLTVHYHLYELPIFRVYMLAMTAMAPAILVVDKSWRTRLFRGRWWLVIICWVLITAGSLAASWVLVGSITPLLTAWATIALLIASLFILCGIVAIVASAVWYGGVKGSAIGLRLMAAGIRRLQ
jgi:hypothetical protein